MSVFVHVSNVIYVYVVYNIHMYTSLIISSSSHTQTTTHRLQYPVQNHICLSFQTLRNQRNPHNRRVKYQETVPQRRDS
ncbi:hypothetical protein YC2023_005784 [Brassica napus]